MCIILETGPLSTLGLFTQSYMAQNHFLTWDQKFGNLCHSTPLKKPLNNIGSQMLVHVDFVELFSNLYVLSVDLATSILNFSSVSLPS